MKDADVESIAKTLYETQRGRAWAKADEAVKQYWRTMVRMAKLAEMHQEQLPPYPPPNVKVQ